MKIKAMYLCIMHPINDNYKLFRVPNMKDKIISIMNRRIESYNQSI